MAKLPEWKRKHLAAKTNVTVTDKRLLVEGFGKRYLGLDPSSVLSNLRAIKYSPKGQIPLMISVQDQKEFALSLLNRTKKCISSEFVVGVSSSPTDDVGLAFAALVAKKALESHDIRVRLLDADKTLSDYKGEEGIEKGFDWKACVIQNVLYDCTQERVQAVRDLIVRQNGVLRIVVIAGGDPVSFFRDRLRIQLDGALLFHGPLVTVKKI